MYDLVCTKQFPDIYKSHGGLTENVPFTNHKKYFIAQMIAYTVIDMKSEQGQSVI